MEGPGSVLLRAAHVSLGRVRTFGIEGDDPDKLPHARAQVRTLFFLERLQHLKPQVSSFASLPRVGVKNREGQ